MRSAPTGSPEKSAAYVEIAALFTNVLKKFFTQRVEFENNQATHAAPPGSPDPRKEGPIEMQDLKDTFSRNAATLPYDFAAVAALVVIFFTALSLPNFI